MKQYNVGVIGATGMVGQRFITLLENHPWFHLAAVAASARSAGKTYEDAIGDRWLMKIPMPECAKKLVVLDAANVEEVASKVDFVFCAVNMKKEEIKALEEAYAKAECPVVSNNSAHRFTPDVPMVVPENILALLLLIILVISMHKRKIAFHLKQLKLEKEIKEKIGRASCRERV